jgi:hypothetical protein
MFCVRIFLLLARAELGLRFGTTQGEVNGENVWLMLAVQFDGRGCPPPAEKGKGNRKQHYGSS